MLQHTCLCSDLGGGEITQPGYFIYFYFSQVYARARASPWVLHSRLKPTPSVFAESSPGGLRRAAVRICASGGHGRGVSSNPPSWANTQTHSALIRECMNQPCTCITSLHLSHYTISQVSSVNIQELTVSARQAGGGG